MIVDIILLSQWSRERPVVDREVGTELPHCMVSFHFLNALFPFLQRRDNLRNSC